MALVKLSGRSGASGRLGRGREWGAAATAASAGGEGWREGGGLLPPSPSSHHHAPRGTGRLGGCPAEGGGEGGSVKGKGELATPPTSAPSALAGRGAALA